MSEEAEAWIEQVEDWANHVHDDSLSVYKLMDELDALAVFIRKLAGLTPADSAPAAPPAVSEKSAP